MGRLELHSKTLGVYPMLSIGGLDVNSIMWDKGTWFCHGEGGEV